MRDTLFRSESMSLQRFEPLTCRLKGITLDLRPYIRGALWAGGLLMIGLVVSGSLWLILTSMSDHAGSEGAKGVALVSIVGLVLDVLCLVVLLALTELGRAIHHTEERQGSSDA